MSTRRTPVERLAINLRTAEKWAAKGKAAQARDMLEACRVVHLPRVPEELREPWQRRLDTLAATLAPTAWQELGEAQPDAGQGGLPRSGVAPPPTEARSDASEPARHSRVWTHLRKALEDLQTASVVLSIPPVEVRFDFVDAAEQVELWATWRGAPMSTWRQPSQRQFIRHASVIAAVDDVCRPHTGQGPEVDSLLVWTFATIPDGRVAIKEELLGLSPDQPPQIRVRRRAIPQAVEDDRAVEAIARRAFREGQGSRRFPVTTCAFCGQPLSDPASVRLGIGPDCRKNYSAAVLEAARKWRPGSVRASGISPGELVGQLRGPW